MCCMHCAWRHGCAARSGRSSKACTALLAANHVAAHLYKHLPWHQPDQLVGGQARIRASNPVVADGRLERGFDCKPRTPMKQVRR